jgi:hypothetical protein
VLDVLDQVVVQGRVGEGQNGFRDVLAGGFNRDIIVLLKVDTAVLLGWIIGGSEELSLKTRVNGAWDVLSVSPLAVTRALSIASTTSTTGMTSGAGVAVRVRVEGRIRASPTAGTTAWSRASTWGWASAWNGIVRGASAGPTRAASTGVIVVVSKNRVLTIVLYT